MFAVGRPTCQAFYKVIATTIEAMNLLGIRQLNTFSQADLSLTRKHLKALSLVV